MASPWDKNKSNDLSLTTCDRYVPLDKKHCGRNYQGNLFLEKQLQDKMFCYIISGTIIIL